MLACPSCHAPAAPAGLPPCGHGGRLEGAIVDLASPEADAVTARVRAFYEERPFPDWREEDDAGTLLRLGRGNPYTRWLDEAIPSGARVVELGCGTGQMSLFLGLCGRAVLGVDISMASLVCAEELRVRIGARSVRLARGDLFAPPVAPGSADVAISSGVLHHTRDPRTGFASLVRCARPGGLVVVGLYNVYGRMLLPLLRRRHAADTTRRGQAWYHDQHEHPRETRHTVDEVLRWMDEEGVRFLRAFPDIGFAGPEVRGAAWEHLFQQLGWLGRAEDGGLFVLVGVRDGVGR